MAGTASRTMYSMASWSPSQSEPLTVSYICQRQSSSPMLPSEAETPPCAATVWLRVGHPFLLQAVLRPASAPPRVAPRPAPPPPPTTPSQPCSTPPSHLATPASPTPPPPPTPTTPRPQPPPPSPHPPP